MSQSPLFSRPVRDENSRRRFLQQVSFGLGAATFAGLAGTRSIGLGSTPGEEGSRKLGVALVGLGVYSTGQLAPALQETKHCRLAGIVTGTPAKAIEWADRYNIPQKNIYNYDTFDDIADNPDIDIVYVVLPVSMHAEYTIRAAEAGKHVICEKPMAMSVRECEQMIEACEKANRKLSIGYRLQFEPHTQEMMRLGRDEVFGKVKMIEASFGFRIGNPNAPHMRWRLQKDMAGGGALMDVGLYAIQGTRQITGEEPVSVSAQEVKTDPVMFSEVDETLFWQLKFPSGAAANCGTSYNANVNRLYASAERGRFALDPAYSYGGLRGLRNGASMDYPQINQQAAQMDDFAQCVIHDRPSRVSGEEGLRDMRIVEGIYKAVETGGTVDLA